MLEIRSTFDTTILEFSDAAKWISSQVYILGSLSEDALINVKNRIAALQPIAEKYERSFRTNNLKLDEEITLNLESAATSLWNSVSVVMKNIDNIPKSSIFLLCQCKMFSAILLSLHSILKSSNEVFLRSLKCFLSVLKMSLDCSKELNNVDGIEKFVQNVQQHGDTYLNILNQDKGSLDDHENDILSQLTFEFYVLNFEVFFKEGDFSTAKIYVSKANLSENVSKSFVNAELVMELVRIIYNTTVLLCQSMPNDDVSHVQEVIYFLKVCQGYLELPMKDLKTHIDHSSMKFSVSTLLVKCLLSAPSGAIETELVRNMLHTLQNEYPKKMLPYLFNISFLKLENLPSRDESISEILMRIITSVDIPDNFDSIISCIKEFSEMNTLLALRSLDYMFMSKLMPERDHELIEKTILSRFFITTQSKLLSEEEVISSLFEYCNHIEKTVMHKLSTQTTSCMITLLWNGGKKSEKNGAFDNSIQFYKLILREAISRTYADKGKVQRALLGVYLKSGQFDQAASTLEEMSAADRRSPITQLLELKINLHQNDEEGILKNLTEIKESGDKKCTDYILFGVFLCKEYPKVFAEGVKLLFDKLSEEQNTHPASAEGNAQPIQILCLIRYSVQVIVKLLDSDDPAMLFSNLDSMEDLMQKALDYMRRIRLGKHLSNGHHTKNDNDLSSEQPSVDELEWLASVAYNVTVKFYNVGTSYPKLPNFAKLAIDLINLIPYTDFVVPKMFHYVYWKFKCSYLSLTVQKELIADQTPPKDHVEQLKLLEEGSSLLLEEIVQFKMNHEFTSSLSDSQLEELDSCLREAAMLQWDIVLSIREPSKIDALLNKSKLFQCKGMEYMLAESVLNSVNLPNRLRDEILTKLLERNLDDSGVENTVLCSLLRNILEQPMCETNPKKYQLTCLLFTRLRLDNTKMGSLTDAVSHELETIATLAWNCGVNSIISEKRDEAIKWCKTAIEIAKLVESGFGDQLKSLWCTLSSTTGVKSAEIDNL